MAKKVKPFDRPMNVSQTAQPVLGKTTTRGKMMSSLWTYIKRKGLQDKKDGRYVHVGKDPAMKRMFPGKKKVHMTGLMGPLNKHVKPK